VFPTAPLDQSHQHFQPIQALRYFQGRQLDPEIPEFRDYQQNRSVQRVPEILVYLAGRYFQLIQVYLKDPEDPPDPVCRLIRLRPVLRETLEVRRVPLIQDCR